MRKISIAVAAVAALALGGLATKVAASGGSHEEQEENEHEHERGGERHGKHGRERGERDGRGRGLAPAPGPERDLYVKECGACHVAYPPALLPGASWARLMAGLEKHFGQNAELDPGVRARLEVWLGAQVGPGAGDAPLRITELAWFRREHREARLAPAAAPARRTFADCGACHAGASRWEFDEDGAKMRGR